MRNGRAVNGFSNGEKSTESRADGRWVLTHGEEWLEELREALEVDFPNVDGDPD